LIQLPSKKGALTQGEYDLEPLPQQGAQTFEAIRLPQREVAKPSRPRPPRSTSRFQFRSMVPTKSISPVHIDLDAVFVPNTANAVDAGHHVIGGLLGYRHEQQQFEADAIGLRPH